VGKYEIHTVNEYVNRPDFTQGCRLAVALATLDEIRLPVKSGFGGRIAKVSPGKCGLGTFALPLDKQKQCQGTARGAVSVATLGNGYACCTTRSLIS
jgi:hypothetical protein